MLRVVSLILIFTLFCGTVFASTEEVSTNFWTEFDITFWQTVPFAAFWGYVAASQLSRGGEINWSPVINFAIGISVLNAVLHARRVACKP